MSTMTASILDSYGDESLSQRFTRPLRGSMGGREFTALTGDQGADIFEVWQRVLAWIVLCTVGLPYTIIACIVLNCSSADKVTKAVSNTFYGGLQGTGIGAPSQKAKDALATIFNGSNLDPASFKIARFEMKNLDSEIPNLTQPVFLTHFDVNDKIMTSLLVPVSILDPSSKSYSWMSTVFIASKYVSDGMPGDNPSWSCYIYGPGIDLGNLYLEGGSDPAEVNVCNELMKGTELTLANVFKCKLNVS